jgi:hypothetical protein
MKDLPKELLNNLQRELDFQKQLAQENGDEGYLETVSGYVKQIHSNSGNPQIVKNNLVAIAAIALLMAAMVQEEEVTQYATTK